MNSTRLPLATYRLQFNRNFTFQHAIELIGYFDELGITDLYASPIMKARPESTHGYDSIDPAKIHLEIGSEEDFIQMASMLKQKGMGLILDIVPNHMCISNAGNHWWVDLLENGPSSLYAPYFDVYWDHPKKELKNKILLPILAHPLGKVIEDQELKIYYHDGSFSLDYKERDLPLNLKSWPAILNLAINYLNNQSLPPHSVDILELDSILDALDFLPEIQETDPHICKKRHQEKELIKKRLGQLTANNPSILYAIKVSLAIINGNYQDPNSFDLLEQILKMQAYRLSYWRLTNDLINYRRFFEINDLACLHTERLDVFEAVHVKVFDFIAAGWVTGLRVDHIDGLYDPKAYLERLQLKQPLAFNIYTIVEKILVGREKLNTSWPIHGTTGYDYLNLINGLFIVQEHHYQLQQFYDNFIGFHNVLDLITYNCKKLILLFSMSSELYILAHRLEGISEQHRSSYDFSFENLRLGLRELIACFPVYRTYITNKLKQVTDVDYRVISDAITMAKQHNLEGDHLIFDFIQSVLLLQDPPGLTSEQIQTRKEFILRFQQLTGPVMAKGFEDTALYRAYPLISLNEVGMDAKSFGIQVHEFHEANQERLQNWPHTLLTTFTHDTKRSEDARARLNVLSEEPHKWKEAINRWRHINKSKKLELNHMEVPDWNEEYLLYQTLVSSWPIDYRKSHDSIYLERIQKYMLKALKEAKIHTSWTLPNENYEAAISEYVSRILDCTNENQFLNEIEQYIEPIIKAGRLNSLSQLLLKMSSPGVPDFYQGSELWEMTLVDPDNRQPIDYEQRQNGLRYIKEAYEKDFKGLIKELWLNHDNGLLKLYLTWIGLNFRKRNPNLFQRGEYIPINISGEKSRHVIAFARRYEEKVCIIAAGRFFTLLADLKTHWPPVGNIWKEAKMDALPIFYGNYRDIISGLEIRIDQQIPLTELFVHFPFAILEVF
jgi:(1->4)-alpha-D-glucan 1-alpha-D-glucosylmutase